MGEGMFRLGISPHSYNLSFYLYYCTAHTFTRSIFSFVNSVTGIAFGFLLCSDVSFLSDEH